LVNGQKMSKSLGNFFTLRDLMAKGHDPLDIRFVLARSHYRAPLDFREDEVKAAKAARMRLRDFRRRMEGTESIERKPDGPSPVKVYRDRFEEAMDDDLNSAAAVAAIFEMVADLHRRADAGELDQSHAGEAVRLLEDADRVFGVFGEEEADLEADILALIREREQARKKKDYARADAIRGDLQQRGIVLEDTPTGTLWKRA
jgi:cysteinyl-tRNA synthetase